MPFKEVAWQLAEVKTPRANLAGAVNTLWRDDQRQLCGDNTDGVGLVNDLTQNLGCSLKGASVLLLGAGGAVRGVIQPLLEAGCTELVIANRTPEKAQILAQHFAATAGQTATLQACGYGDIPLKHFDVIINGTSASLQGDLPPLPEGIVGTHTLCYDMMYAATQTPFCRWASAHGAGRAVDGLGMLVEQAAEAFYIWRDQRPDTAPVIALLRQSLAQQ
ncbi:shikimate dehydrogenase [Nitrincola sp. A-D6]|uniref:shikimate dehydrogenase n=1 Tax=Nitrincola sp. A-D6 TaxID=1545442 RepID=UPI000B212B53